MSDLALSVFILFIFWATQLFSRSWFYFRKKPKHSSKPPLTAEEGADLDRFVTEHFPPTQTKSVLPLLLAIPRVVIGECSSCPFCYASGSCDLRNGDEPL